MTFRDDGCAVDGAEVIHEPARNKGSKKKSGNRLFSSIKIGKNSRPGVLSVDMMRIKNTGRLFAAAVGQTKAGNPRLLAFDRARAKDGTGIIGVFRWGVGFRGSNEYTGDRHGYECSHWEGDTQCSFVLDEPMAPGKCPQCGHESLVPRFHPFPGNILTEARVKEGHSIGRHIIAALAAGSIFRAAYEGQRIDGGPPEMYYYVAEGGQVLQSTWAERVEKGDW